LCRVLAQGGLFAGSWDQARAMVEFV